MKKNIFNIFNSGFCVVTKQYALKKLLNNKNKSFIYLIICRLFEHFY